MQTIKITSVEPWGFWQRVEEACRTTHLLQGLVRQRNAAPQALQEGCRVLVLLRICWHALQGALQVVRDAQQAAHEFLQGRPQCCEAAGRCAVARLTSALPSPAPSAYQAPFRHLHLQRSSAQPLSVRRILIERDL